jgi:CheY-like chemotaxis protein
MATILIVDDIAEIRWALAENLSDLGHTVHWDCNGRDALETLRRLAERNKLPKLVVTDFDMPEMTGEGLIRACRADPALAKISFILCSGNSDSDRIAKSLAVPFYSKFERFKHLIDKINKALEDVERMELWKEVEDWRASELPFGKMRKRFVDTLTEFGPFLKSLSDKKDLEEILNVLTRLASADDKSRDAWTSDEHTLIFLVAGQVIGYMSRTSVRAAITAAHKTEATKT